MITNELNLVKKEKIDVCNKQNIARIICILSGHAVSICLVLGDKGWLVNIGVTLQCIWVHTDLSLTSLVVSISELLQKNINYV